MATDEIPTTPSLLGVVDGPPLPAQAQRALTFGLLVSAFRCTVQYVLLPFVLPWVGLTAAIPAWITLVLGALAIAALIRNVRTLWRMRHARRWSYLFLALMVGASLVIFSVVDARTLFHL